MTTSVQIPIPIIRYPRSFRVKLKDFTMPVLKSDQKGLILYG